MGAAGVGDLPYGGGQGGKKRSMLLNGTAPMSSARVGGIVPVVVDDLAVEASG